MSQLQFNPYRMAVCRKTPDLIVPELIATQTTYRTSFKINLFMAHRDYTDDSIDRIEIRCLLQDLMIPLDT